MRPPVTEQQSISDYLDVKCAAIDSAISKKETLIDKLTAYKKSLIYEAVTGKVEIKAA
jgi:type I restriction enzyme S subunit